MEKFFAALDSYIEIKINNTHHMSDRKADKVERQLAKARDEMHKELQSTIKDEARLHSSHRPGQTI